MPGWLDWTTQQQPARAESPCGPAESKGVWASAAEAPQPEVVSRGDAVPGTAPSVQEMCEPEGMEVDWGDDVQPETPDRQPGARLPKRTEDQLNEPDPEEEKQRNLQREREALRNLEKKFGYKEKFFDVLQCDARLVDTTDPRT